MEIQMDQLQAWFRMVAYLIDRGLCFSKIVIFMM